MRPFLYLALLTLSLSGCTPINSSFKASQNSLISSLDYETFIDNKIQYNNLFSLSKQGYFVYIYSLNCLHCKHIKDNVLIFLNEHQESFFLLEYSKEIPLIDDASSTIGKDDYLYFGIRGTPTLIYIYNRIIEMNISGEDIILSFLASCSN